MGSENECFCIDRYVLTAAHCLIGRTPYNLEVILNADKTIVGQEGFLPDRHSVQSIIAHRNYTSSLDYDAALIKLTMPVDLSHTAPICLPLKGDGDFAGVYATVTGWGYTMEDGEVSASLRKASVQVISNDKCRDKYSKVTDRMLCAAAPGTDACQVRSSSPFLLPQIV